jgi:hypothetical protein
VVPDLSTFALSAGVPETTSAARPVGAAGRGAGAGAGAGADAAGAGVVVVCTGSAGAALGAAKGAEAAGAGAGAGMRVTTCGGAAGGAGAGGGVIARIAASGVIIGLRAATSVPAGGPGVRNDTTMAFDPRCTSTGVSGATLKLKRISPFRLSTSSPWNGACDAGDGAAVLAKENRVPPAKTRPSSASVMVTRATLPSRCTLTRAGVPDQTTRTVLRGPASEIWMDSTRAAAAPRRSETARSELTASPVSLQWA